MCGREHQRDVQDDRKPEIRWGRVDTFVVHAVTDSELDILQKGSWISVSLNFAIFFFSVAFTCLVTLLTAPPKDGAAYMAFVVFTAVGASLGLVLLLLWLCNRRSVSRVVANIRKRLPAESDAHGTAPQDESAEELVILQANYGTHERHIDVTEHLASMVLNGRLQVKVLNEIAGDPHKGVRKKLFVKYMSRGKTYTVETPERQILSLPPPEH